MDYLTLAISFIGLVISIASLRIAHREKQKKIAYEIISSKRLLENLAGEKSSRVQILFEDKIVTDISKVIIKIWNSGYKSFTKADYLKPITLDFGKAIILYAKVVEKLPKSIELSIEQNPEKITILPDLLKAKESITLEILLSGYQNKDEVHMEARIEEAGSRTLHIRQASLHNSNHALLGSLSLLCCVIGFLVLFNGFIIPPYGIIIILLLCSIGLLCFDLWHWIALHKKGVRVKGTDWRIFLSIFTDVNISSDPSGSIFVLGFFYLLIIIAENIVFLISPSMGAMVK